MDKQEEFVRKYVRKRYRDRLLYELNEPEKRTEGLDRFAHQVKDLLDEKRIVLSDSNLENSKSFADFMQDRDKHCLLLSADLELDGRELELDDAIKAALFSFDAVIIVGADYALVFAEPGKGGRDKYLLC